MGFGHDSAEYWAARLALLGLASTSGNDYRDAPSSYHVLPDLDFPSVEEAARELQRRTKPVRCGAKRRGGVLIVDCKSLTGDEELSLHAWLRAGLDARGGLFNFVRRRPGDNISDRLVRCMGPYEELTLTVACIEAYNRDYVQSPQTGFTLRAMEGDTISRDSEIAAMLVFRERRGIGNLGLRVPGALVRLFKLVSRRGFHGP